MKALLELFTIEEDDNVSDAASVNCNVDDGGLINLLLLKCLIDCDCSDANRVVVGEEDAVAVASETKRKPKATKAAEHLICRLLRLLFLRVDNDIGVIGDIEYIADGGKVGGGGVDDLSNARIEQTEEKRRLFEAMIVI